MRKTTLAGAAAAAVAAALAITVAATASTSTRTEHFSFIDTSNNPKSHLYSAIATGAFTAGGTADLSGHGSPSTMHFSDGTITFEAKLPPLKTNGNAKLCLETTTDSGTYTILSGTGAYKGISGTGTSTLDFRAVGPIVNGKCSIPTTVADQNIITASGPVSLAQRVSTRLRRRSLAENRCKRTRSRSPQCAKTVTTR